METNKEMLPASGPGRALNGNVFKQSGSGKINFYQGIQTK